MIFNVPSKPRHSVTPWTYHESYNFSLTSNSITAQLLWQDTPLSSSIMPYHCGKLSIAISIVVTRNNHCRLVFPLPGDTFSSTPKLWSCLQAGFPHPSSQKRTGCVPQLNIVHKIQSHCLHWEQWENVNIMYTWYPAIYSTISRKLLLFSFKTKQNAYQIFILTIRMKNNYIAVNLLWF